jgi:predicted nucleic acid-binding protein
MKVLLDTNIIIEREATKINNREIGSLFRWLDRLYYEKCIHNLTLDEIKKHQDKKVREAFEIKLENYVLLKTEAPKNNLVEEMGKIYPDHSPNDLNDTRLLNELINKRVDFLITEDRKIHKKSKILGIDNLVFTIESFLEKVISENPDLIEYKNALIKKEFFGNINVKTEFFDTFRRDYNEFEKWFNGKSEEIAYIFIGDKSLLGFLYVKREGDNENYQDIFPPFSRKKRLKIGTLKVTLNGYRIGERFLKIIFDNALKQKVEELYVTIFDNGPEKIRLIHLLEDWGFKYWGIKKTSSGEEKVYVRDFDKKFNNVNPKLTFPNISLNSEVYIVPIYPSYHTNLFPDSILNTESPASFAENESFRNALSKVYVSRSFNRNLNSGDIIIFYRTKETGKPAYYSSVVTTIGIVESVVKNIKTEKEFLELCRKRSVFTDKELLEQWNYKKDKPFIVNFLYAYSFPHKLNLNELIRLGIISDINNVPRGFEKISREKFEKIIEHTKTDKTLITSS